AHRSAASSHAGLGESLLHSRLLRSLQTRDRQRGAGVLRRRQLHAAHRGELPDRASPAPGGGHSASRREIQGLDRHALPGEAGRTHRGAVRRSREARCAPRQRAHGSARHQWQCVSNESGRLIEQAELIEQARLLNVSLGDAEAQRLALLLDELERWNAAYNLTSIRGREAMIAHHLLDSLSIHEYLKGARIADVGTGAGFPGLPLAVANPERQFTLIDSAGKKVRFVAHAARALGLGNVEAVHSRAEDMRPAEPFDTITARAFAGLPDLLESVYSLSRPGTRVLAMKG